MQSFTPNIAGSTLVKDSRAPLLANDNTVLSHSEGTAFPTGAVVVVGMTCYRSDQGKLYECKDLTGTSGGPTWVVIADLSKTYLSQETADSRYVPGNTAAYKNGVIHGDFALGPWQHGGGIYIFNSTINRVADRWCVTRSNQGSQYNAQKVTTGEAAFPNAFRLFRLSTDTVVVPCLMGHNFETAEIQRWAGKSVTLAIRGKKSSNLSGTCTLALVYGTGTDQNVLTGLTGQTTLATIDLQTLSSSAFSELYATATVPTTATQLALIITHTPATSAGTQENLDMEIIQLEQAPLFTGWERRPLQVETQLCRRFLPFFSGASGIIASTAAISTTTAHVHLKFTHQTRVAPTGITTSNGTHFGVRDRTGTLNATTALTFVDASTFGCTLLATIGTAALTAGDGGTFVLNNASAKIWLNGAEL